MQRPSPESVAAREHLISELTDYLNRERFHWGHPHSPTAMPLSIEPFGSIRFGLGTSGSDLDLCLLDPYRPNGFEEKWYSSRKEHMQDLPDIYQMRKLGNSLYRAGLENIHPMYESISSLPADMSLALMMNGSLVVPTLQYRFASLKFRSMVKRSKQISTPTSD